MNRLSLSLFLCLLSVGIFSIDTSAQSPCVDGLADNTYPCNEVDLLSHVPIEELADMNYGIGGSVRGSDIWGWTDPETGSEYALVGLTNGTSFVDVSIPEDPAVLGFLPSNTDYRSTWRDIKVYNNHAFIVSDISFGHGVQIFDLTRLRDIEEGENLLNLSEDEIYFGPPGNQMDYAHNVVINENSGRAYVVGGTNCSQGLSILDITSPQSPTFKGCYADSDNAYVHDAQCIIYNGPDEDHQGKEVCLNSNEEFISIVDVTNGENPQLISRAFYPNTGYTHQGWITDDQKTFIVNDELDDDVSSNTRTMFFDVEDLDNPEFSFFYYGETLSTDHNLYTKENYVFMSNYKSGLRILEISDTSSEEGVYEVAYFDTYPSDDNGGFQGQWSNYPYFESGNVVVSDINRGLFVLDPTGLTVSAENEPESTNSDILTSPTPNPAHTTTRMEFLAPRSGVVHMVLLDALGREVASLLEGEIPEGTSMPISVPVDNLASGTYVVRVIGDGFEASQSITVTR